METKTLKNEASKLVITENIPEDKWTLEYNSLNSSEAVEIPKQVAKVLLFIKGAIEKLC